MLFRSEFSEPVGDVSPDDGLPFPEDGEASEPDGVDGPSSSTTTSPDSPVPASDADGQPDVTGEAALSPSHPRPLLGCITAGLAGLASPPPAERSSSPSAAASPGPGSFELGGFTIWGVDGDTVAAADFAYDAAAQTLTVNTDKHFAIQNTDQEKETSGPYEGHLVHLSPVGIVIPASRNAHITLANVAISAAVALDIRPDASCSLILADGTANRLEGTQAYKAALHCPTGASLTDRKSVV